MNIIYLVFGENKQNHLQASFSILSLFAQTNDFEKVIVITDNAHYYNHIHNQKLFIETIDNELLNEWKGEYQFFWRIKIKALEMIQKKWPSQHLLYLDADTFFYDNLNTIEDLLNKGNNLMHLNEGKLSETKSKSNKKLWNKLKNKSFGNITINSNHCMWNAGVVGLSKNNAYDTIKLSLDICDDMCSKDIPRRLIEQFSFSLALNHYNKLLSAKNTIGHFWGNKSEWNLLITDFFLEAFLLNLSFDDQIKRLQKIDLLKTPVYVKTSNTGIRLKKQIDKLFPNKNKIFSK